jgi:hypothetical protein
MLQSGERANLSVPRNSPVEVRAIASLLADVCARDLNENVGRFVHAFLFGRKLACASQKPTASQDRADHPRSESHPGNPTIVLSKILSAAPWVSKCREYWG